MKTNKLLKYVALVVSLSLGLMAGRVNANSSLSYQCYFQTVSSSSDSCDDELVGNELRFNGEHEEKFPQFSGDSGAKVTGFIRPKYGDVGIGLELGGHTSGPSLSLGYVSADASWSEDLIVTSDSLSIGTPAPIEIAHVVELTILSLSESSQSNQSLRFESLFDSLLIVGNYSDGLSVRNALIYDEIYDKSIIFNTTVGATFNASYLMQATLLFETGSGVLGNSTDYSSFFSNIDARHSGHVYITPMDADITLISSSGHNYARPISAIPEPETYGMMLMGLGLMGFVARRRKNQQF